MNAKAKLVAAGLLLSAMLIMPWEGRELRAYQDVVGIWTICDGATRGVRPGQVATAQECDAMLYRDLLAVDRQMSACIGRPVAEGVRAAVNSWAYNVGAGSACRSTLVRKLRAGDVPGACNELLRWTYAGGKELAGLKRRRQAEHRVCLGGKP